MTASPSIGAGSSATAPTRKLRLLVVYKGLGYPLRTTMVEHLYAFGKYSNSQCYYLGLDSIHRIPDYLLEIEFDLIIFHYGFVATRWAGRKGLEEAVEQVRPLFSTAAIKAIMPQDEYKNSADICWLINSCHIDCVFSVSPVSEWPVLYPTVDRAKVRFYQVLTGYLDEDSIARLAELGKTEPRTIDIGYRARNLPPWLGRHGYLKTEIAEVFKSRNAAFGLKLDVSTRPADTFFGDDWYRFLLRCKYFIGVEGGATVHDPTGEIWTRGEAYLKAHPNATFDEVEAACFPGLDGKLRLIAISPRHLEACATKTCQILVEGTFNGVLKPDLHYIPLRADFSNLDEVLQSVKDDTKRAEITERAYQDIVLSGQWTYRRAVRDMIFEAVGVDVMADSYLTLRAETPPSLALNESFETEQWRFARMHDTKWYRYLYRYRGRRISYLHNGVRLSYRYGGRMGHALVITAKVVAEKLPVVLARSINSLWHRCRTLPHRLLAPRPPLA
jgi:hypothetical protein